MTEQETLKHTLELMLLPGKGQLRIPQKARKLSITEYTVYRCLGTLRECGFTVEKDKGGSRIAGLLPKTAKWQNVVNLHLEEGAENLLALQKKIDTGKMKEPSFLMVLTANGKYPYRHRDGVFVTQTGCFEKLIATS